MKRDGDHVPVDGEVRQASLMNRTDAPQGRQDRCEVPLVGEGQQDVIEQGDVDEVGDQR